MTCSLLDIPTELEEMILDELEDIDYHVYSNTLLPLSSTCKYFRDRLSPRIFWFLMFTNEPRSANRSLSIAKKYGEHFQRLNFTGVAKSAKEARPRRKASNIKPWGQREDEILCPAARELLLGTHTPNASWAKIKWDFDFASDESEFALDEDTLDSVDWTTGMSRHVTYFFEDEETREDIKDAEAEQPWRVLMNLVWRTLAKNPFVHGLDLPRTIPKLTTAFTEENPSWRPFLQRLKRINIYFSKERDSLHDACILPGFGQFTGSLHEVFLSDAKDLDMLSIIGPEHGLLGQEAKIKFESLHFPKLMMLQLWHICLDRSLLEFLRSHATFIQLLMFQDCWGIDPPWGEERVWWADIFKAVTGPNSALGFIECLPDDDLCYIRCDGEAGNEEYYEADECDSIFKDSEEKRPFPYAMPDEELGFAEPSAIMVLDAFEKGYDQIAYDALMAQLKEKKVARASKTLHKHAEL